MSIRERLLAKLRGTAVQPAAAPVVEPLPVEAGVPIEPQPPVVEEAKTDAVDLQAQAEAVRKNDEAHRARRNEPLAYVEPVVEESARPAARLSGFSVVEAVQMAADGVAWPVEWGPALDDLAAHQLKHLIYQTQIRQPLASPFQSRQAAFQLEEEQLRFAGVVWNLKDETRLRLLHAFQVQAQAAGLRGRSRSLVGMTVVGPESAGEWAEVADCRAATLSLRPHRLGQQVVLMHDLKVHTFTASDGRIHVGGDGASEGGQQVCRTASAYLFNFVPFRGATRHVLPAEHTRLLADAIDIHRAVEACAVSGGGQPAGPAFPSVYLEYRDGDGPEADADETPALRQAVLEEVRAWLRRGRPSLLAGLERRPELLTQVRELVPAGWRGDDWDDLAVLLPTGTRSQLCEQVRVDRIVERDDRLLVPAEFFSDESRPEAMYRASRVFFRFQQHFWGRQVVRQGLRGPMMAVDQSLSRLQVWRLGRNVGMSGSSGIVDYDFEGCPPGEEGYFTAAD